MAAVLSSTAGSFVASLIVVLVLINAMAPSIVADIPVRTGETAAGSTIDFAGKKTILPGVLWHGMGRSCCDDGMEHLKALIEELGVPYVRSIELGATLTEDVYNSYIGNLNDQVAKVCDELAADKKLSGGFNAIGLSQGSQFLRAYIQRCNTPPVRAYISLGGQHQGVYGFPGCNPPSALCMLARRLLSTGPYSSTVQRRVVQAQYWKDPKQLDVYRSKSIFLADINNEGPAKKALYRRNLESLDLMVLVMFTNDSVVIPVASQWFGFFTPGQAVTMQPMEETDLYTEDWIGLKALDKAGKLKLVACEGEHLRFSPAWFSAVIGPILKGDYTAVSDDRHRVGASSPDSVTDSSAHTVNVLLD